MPISHTDDASPRLCGRRRRTRFGVAAAAALVLAVALQVAASVPARADVGCTTWQRPSPARVVDPFRPPAHIGAPGNRGWELETAPGDPIAAAAPGVVTFAGWVAGRRYVTVAHCDGLRTSYSWLSRIDVTLGERVRRGQIVGSAGGRVHFGLRLGGRYLDPATLFGDGVVRVRLVPLPGWPVASR